MAELHDLSPAPGSHRDRKRVGRGPGSGKGKRSGRGQKGQKARSGGQIPPGFEGGQMPLHRRLPKRGFNNVFRTEYQVVNVRDMNDLEGEVTPATLVDAGLVGHAGRPVKILGDGELEVALEVSAHAFSGSARDKIEGAGGSATVLDFERANQIGPAIERTGDTTDDTDGEEASTEEPGAEAAGASATEKAAATDEPEGEEATGEDAESTEGDETAEDDS